MPTTIVLEIDGNTIDVPTDCVLGPWTAFSRGGHPTLPFYRRGGTLAAVPDPWAAKAVTLTINGTLYFAGDVVSGPEAEYHDDIGWVQAFQALGIRWRGDLVPVTDETTGLDTVPYNQQPESPEYIAARAGRTVGEILQDVLEMPTNAQNLDAYGIGGYTGLPSAPALAAATVTDLAALTLIPPQPVRVAGEKFLCALDGFLQGWAPNYWLHIEPGGTIRFLDQRTFTNDDFDMDNDPVLPARLGRRYGDCFPRVVVRGQPAVVPMLVSTRLSSLTEDFGYGAVSSATAKAAYVPGQGNQPATAADTGTCTCPSTTTVTVTSSDATRTWASDYWDQTSTGAHGWVYLWYSAGSGITQGFSAQIVSNTSLSAAGTSTLTLASTLPITSYDNYSIYGLNQGPQKVYRSYLVANTTIRASLAQQFMGTVPFILANGQSATLVSSPTASVVWPSSPGNEVTSPVTVDPSSGHVYFWRPTYEIAGNSDPYDVRVLLAVNTGANRVASPVDVSGVPQYDGTSNSVEGLERTLVVTLDQWRDPGQLAQVQAYADDLLDARKDTIIEGSISYLGLFEAWLTPGRAASVTGPGTTGWEGLELPVQEVTITAWDAASQITMTARCSNRRNALGAGGFMHPERTGQMIGGDFSPFAGHVGGMDYKVGNVEQRAGGEGAYGGPKGQNATLGDTGFGDMSGIATDPGQYMQDMGLPTGEGMMGSNGIGGPASTPTLPEVTFTPASEVGTLPEVTFTPAAESSKPSLADVTFTPAPGKDETGG